MKNNNNSVRTDLFETVPVKKAVMTLALPTVIGSLVMVLYSLADTLFVGMLNDTTQTAAVTLAAPVLLAFNAINNLFGVGSSSMMSRALGAKDMDTVKKSSAFGFWCAIGGGLLISLLCLLFFDPLLHLLGAGEADGSLVPTRNYMIWTVICGAIPSILNVVMGNLVRAEGNALHGSIGTMCGCLLNVILDPFFILPQYLNMGAAGAGLATCISNTVACLYFFGFLLVKRKSTSVCIDPHEFTLDRKIVGGVCGVGVPAAIQNLLNVTGMTVLNNFASAFGTATTSAIGIAHKVTMVPMYIAMGTSQGVMPLVSYNWSARNSSRMKESILFTAKLTVLFLIPAALLLCVFGKSIIGMFMADPAVCEIGAIYMIGMSLAQPFLGIDFLGVGIYQACGMGKTSLLFAILRKIVLEIPALFLLRALFGREGIGFAQLVAEVILSVAAIICIAKVINLAEENEKAEQTS